MSGVIVNNLIRQLNEIQEGSLWFDQYFKDKFDHLTDKEALTIPLPQLHSVAEHVSHMLEWRKECILRFKGLMTELMNSPNDWKNDSELKKMGWSNLKSALYDSRFELINLIANKEDSFLETKFLDTEYNYLYLIEGIIHHDIYHMGQIGITIKLLKEKKISVL